MSERKMYILFQDIVERSYSFRLGDIILYPTNALRAKVARSFITRQYGGDFPRFGELNRDGTVHSYSHLPTMSREYTTPWTGYIEKHSFRSEHDHADFLEVLKLEGDQEQSKAGLMKYTFDKLETLVLNDAQDYIKSRADNDLVVKEMDRWGELPPKPVRNHLKIFAMDLNEFLLFSLHNLHSML